ncbi:element excision factor XisH family protein [Microseira wollei]|nr:element excision factor XisH family protein [Microseira wollei]
MSSHFLNPGIVISMPQYDFYHFNVRNALIKDGWTITDDPFKIEYEDIKLYADLGAEKIFAAEKCERKIVVEIKVFNSPSLITELQKTLGQYSIYRSYLKRTNPERKLYLAIGIDIYQDFFQRPSIQVIIEDYDLKIIVFNPDTEEIIQWTS